MAALLAVLVAACAGETAPEAPAGMEAPAGLASVSSPAFADGGEIPVEHTCDGEDIPPPLRWEGAPAEAAEVVVVVDDADADGFVHWIVAGVPPAGGVLRLDALPPEAFGGTNGFGGLGWAGPCPPEGDDPHTYRFQVVALAEPSGLGPGFTIEELEAATAGARLAASTLTATYGR